VPFAERNDHINEQCRRRLQAPGGIVASVTVRKQCVNSAIVSVRSEAVLIAAFT